MPWNPWKFPGSPKKPGASQERESPDEELRRVSEAELQATDLSDEALLALPPAELIRLNARLGVLRDSIPEQLGGQPEQVRELWNMPFNQVLARVQFLTPHQKELLLERLDLEALIGTLDQRIRGEKKLHWEQVFASLRNKGITPFGDIRSVYADVLKETMGVNIINPTPQDVDRYFELTSYAPNAISRERWLRVEAREGTDATLAEAFVLIAGRYEEPDESAPNGKRKIDQEEEEVRMRKLRQEASL